MRIAIVSPLYESVPPRLYGGTERIVSFLTEELVRMGLDVTLYASGDSETSARLVPCAPSALRLDPSCVDRLVHHLLMVERVVAESDRYDLIHWHIDYLHYAMSRRMRTPHVTTLHGRLDLPELAPLYHEYRDIPLISISDAQRTPLPFARWQATVHHGLPIGAYSFEPRPGDYLAFLGRASPEKGLDRAIEIAVSVGLPLRIAAKVDREDALYFEREIRPLLSRPGVEWLGELGEREKPEFLGKARALLFPIDWPEPFGLVMIEAMACGTPVVAFRRGSVPEVIEDGVTGFVVDGVDEAMRRLEQLDRIDRRECRRTFERRFDAHRMAEDYVAVYETLVATGRAAA